MHGVDDICLSLYLHDSYEAMILSYDESKPRETSYFLDFHKTRLVVGRVSTVSIEWGTSNDFFSNFPSLELPSNWREMTYSFDTRLSRSEDIRVSRVDGGELNSTSKSFNYFLCWSCEADSRLSFFLTNHSSPFFLQRSRYLAWVDRWNSQKLISKIETSMRTYLDFVEISISHSIQCSTNDLASQC